MKAKKAKKLFETYNNEWKGHHVYSHSLKVMNNAGKISYILGIKEAEKKLIRKAAKYHDIGKIMYKPWMLIPHAFEKKKLTKLMMYKIKKHAKDGYEILKVIYGDDSIAELVLFHHEKIDGSGFPYKLKGEKIPIGARIITVCDAYDSMTEHYNLKTKEETVKDLKKQSGNTLDSKVVSALFQII